MRLLSIDARIAGRDRAALAALIESADADLACLHHGPQLLRWRSITAAIGRRSGLVVVVGGRRAGANVVLCDLGVDSSTTSEVDLGGTRTAPAGAALALLRHDGVDLTLVSANLTGDDGRRGEQAARLQRAVEQFTPGRPPAILSVSGAERAGGAARETLSAGRSVVGNSVFVSDALTARVADHVTGPHGTATVIEIG